MKGNRHFVIDILQTEVTKNIITDRRMLSNIKDELFKNNNLMKGDTQRLLKYGVDEIEDDTFLCLLMTAIYKHMNAEDKERRELMNPANYFSEREIAEAKQADYSPTQDYIDFPIELENVLKVDDNNFIAVIPSSFLFRLLKSKKLYYNFDTQRNALVRKHKYGNISRRKNVNRKSVQEIYTMIKNNTYKPDTFTLNIRFGSGEEGQDEVVYDAKKMKLIIRNARIDILDGFHRFQAFKKMHMDNPDFDMNLQVAIKWYNVKEARAYVGQVATVNKVDRSHLAHLKDSRKSDLFVKKLQNESDLKGKVSTSSKPSAISNELTSFAVLSDTINELHQFETTVEMERYVEYYAKFFNHLIGLFPKYFISDVSKIRKNSLINNNNTFAGYLALCKRFMEDGIPIEKLHHVIESIDFSKDNGLWEQIGVIKNGTVTSNARKQMVKFFNEINIAI